VVSAIPFEGPVAGVRLALKDGEWIPFPTYDELDESVFELVVAGGRNADGGIDIIMVEAGSTPDGCASSQRALAASDEETVARGSRSPSSTSVNWSICRASWLPR
jgi:polyribonucleotide nucleotidyltransferase